MSLRLPKCEFCQHFRGYKDGRMKCRAFPDGIPEDKNIYDYGSDSECANGIRFEDQDGGQAEFVPEPGSMLAQMQRI